MDRTTPAAKESIDGRLIEDICQINNISLGEGAVACQVCGSSLCEGDAVAVYVFRPAGEVMFQVGFVVCGDAGHYLPEVFTLGVRELVVEGRVGWCSDAGSQSSWRVLIAPVVVAVSAAATKSLRRVPGDGAVVGTESGTEGAEQNESPVESPECESHDAAEGGVRGGEW